MPDIWYVADDHGQVGPLTLQELKATLATFSDDKDVLVWCDRFPDWKRPKDIPELNAQTSSPPPLPTGPGRGHRMAFSLRTTAIAVVLGGAALASLFLFAHFQAEVPNKSDGDVVATKLLSDKAETSHLAFVSEYVRELGVNENSRAQAEREITEPTDKNATMIRNSTRIVFELTSHVGMLKGMSLRKPFDTLPAQVAAFYEEKIRAHNQMIAMASALMSGPKPGVDYSAIGTEAPKLTAIIEYIDRSLFDATPLIFATLIDEKPDKEGHVSRLTITRAERDDVVRNLQLSFGKKLEQADQNYIVSSASVLRRYLSEKGYKCSDDPL